MVNNIVRYELKIRSMSGLWWMSATDNFLYNIFIRHGIIGVNIFSLSESLEEWAACFTSDIICSYLEFYASKAIVEIEINVAK